MRPILLATCILLGALIGFGSKDVIVESLYGYGHGSQHIEVMAVSTPVGALVGALVYGLVFPLRPKP